MERDNRGRWNAGRVSVGYEKENIRKEKKK